jgi:RimJ/RimL family protein N-acetyltransferase
VDVPPIRSHRLDLVSMSPSFMEAVLDGRRADAAELLGAPLPDGWPDQGGEGFLRRRLDQMRADAKSQAWLVRALVLRSEGVMVGHAGFHGPPGTNGPAKADAVEFGYTVFPAYRRRGYATEAAQGLMTWAGGQGIRHFVASVAPDNAPSLAIVRKLGFVQTGEQWDEEDGLELVFELDSRSK